MRRRLAGSACTRWTSAVAGAFAAALLAVPSGIHDDDDRVAEWRNRQALRAAAVEQARQTQARDLARRYRRPVGEVERIMHAAERAARHHGLPSSLLLAIAETESSLNPKARSRYGAVGLMQVVPRHHPVPVTRAGGPGRLLEAETAMAVGAGILADYIARSDGDLRRGLHRYSGGAAGYAERVLARQTALEQAAANQLAVAQAALQPEAPPQPIGIARQAATPRG